MTRHFRNTIALTLATALAPLLAAPLVATSAEAQVQIPILPLPGPNRVPGWTPQLPPDALRGRGTCPDLAASISQRNGPGGSIIVTFQVRNVSRVPYVSGANQQLLNVSMGRNHWRSYRFQNLEPGQSRSWQTTYRPFEFPVTYRATIVYDPDILLDGNPQNDDCNAANNSATLTTAR